MRRASRVDAFEIGYYAAGRVNHPEMAQSMDNCMRSLGLGSAEWLPLERVVERVTNNRPELESWYHLGSSLALNMRALRTRWADLSLRSAFESVGVTPQVFQHIAVQVKYFVEQPNFLHLNQSPETIAALGTMKNLYDPLAQEIFEYLRDVAREQDEKEIEHMALDNRLSKDNRSVHVTITGDVSGTLNLGEITGDIYSSVARLSQAPATKDVAEILRALTKGISSDGSLHSKAKTEALQAVEAIADQAKLPEPERKGWLVKAAMSHLPQLLGSAETTLKLWDTYGPSLRDFFKAHF